MNFNQLKPWNWFQKEESENKSQTPSNQNWPHKMQEDMEHMFNNMMNMLSVRSGQASDIPLKGPWTPLTLKPNVDIAEHEDHYKITVEVPGIDKEDIQMEVSDGSLVITGEKKIEKNERDENVNWHRIERSYGAFRRMLDLPDDSDAENIDAKFNNGVLDIKIPRTQNENLKGRKIEIRKVA